MPRLKRSQKRGPVVAPEIRPPARVTATMVAALCPLCGRSVPENRAIKIGHVTVDRVNYFGSIDWDPNKPFGVRFQAGGKGSLRDWEHIGPEEAPELFEAMKRRFLDALGEWLDKGWITPGEVTAVLK